MDDELLGLCKDVYKRLPEWDDTDSTFKRLMGMNSLKWKDWFIADYNNGKWNDVGEQSIPLYTSDYLLSKLPWSTVCSGPNMGMFAAWMNGSPKETFQEADTPLKALLKLVIALDDAGELK